MMSFCTAGYGKNPCCFLLLSLNAAGGGSGSSPGSFCAARAWSAHTVSSRGRFCRDHAAWPGRVPVPLPWGRGLQRGQKPQRVGVAGDSRAGDAAVQEPAPGQTIQLL